MSSSRIILLNDFYELGEAMKHKLYTYPFYDMWKSYLLTKMFYL